MKRLVRKRAEIFEVQRGGRNRELPRTPLPPRACLTLLFPCADSLQASSRKRVEAHFEADLSQAPYLSAFRNYLAFCAKCDIPPFPMTQTIVALWLFDKCSIRDGFFQTYKSGLMLACELVFASWKNDELYWEVSLFDPNGIALSEFLTERRLAHKNRKRNVTGQFRFLEPCMAPPGRDF